MRILAAISAFLLALLATTASAQDTYSQAVDAYNKNLFPQALTQFRQVSGPRAQDAQQYVKKINSYMEAIQLAKGIMDRSPDERDANSLQFAIQQYQLAITIKPDGPWNPTDLLAKARALKAQVEKAHAASSNAMDMEFCAKAIAASSEHRFKEAAQLICAVANDNPGYSCGGDEAVHMCQVNTDLAKLGKIPADKITPEKTPDRITAKRKVPDQPPPAPVVERAANSAALDQAKAAYSANNFERARTLFQHVDANSKPAAADYLDKISRYNEALASAEKSSRAGQYDSARTSFVAAAAIKPDGPDDPQTRAATMELLLGLDQFYSGDYVSAIQQLQDYSRTGTQKQPLARFYLGASKLARYFVTGSEDSALQQDALNDLKIAKQAGFKTTNQDISPKLLEAYTDLKF
jgi:tetratricopeptide (TPR) repeat protein